MHHPIKYLVLLLVLSETFIDCKILAHQAGESADCVFNQLLGIGSQKPCHPKLETDQEGNQRNQVSWNLGNQQGNHRTTSPRPQSFGIWNFEQPSGSEQNERRQNGNEFKTYQKSGYDFRGNGKKEEVIITNIPEGQSNQVGPSSQTTKTSPKLGPDNGRRIISARSNCPEGFRADARGRCREIM